MGRAIPQSVCDRAELLARAHPLQTVAEILGLHPGQITRMKKRGWRQAGHNSHARPMPSDFAIMAGRMSYRELVQHYRAGNDTIGKWLQVTRPKWKAGRPKR